MAVVADQDMMRIESLIFDKKAHERPHQYYQNQTREENSRSGSAKAIVGVSAASSRDVIKNANSKRVKVNVMRPLATF